MQRILYFLVFLISLSLNNLVFAETINAKKIIRIGTGNILQGYYPIGIKLCKFIQSANPGVGCDAISTRGSVNNLDLLKQGKLDFALIQSDVGYEAYYGIGFYEGQLPFEELLQIFSFHDEVFTIIVKDEDKIKVFSDIEGKKIVNGNEGSGSSITYNNLRKYYKFINEPIDIEVNKEEYADKFCHGEIDAIIMMTGHPNSLTSHIAHNCEVDFVSIEQDKIDSFIKDNPTFKQVKLSKGLYSGITEDQNTIASSAILVTTNKIDKNLLDNFIKHFHKNFLEFKSSHLLLQNLNEQDLKKQSILPTNKEFIGKK